MKKRYEFAKNLFRPQMAKELDGIKNNGNKSNWKRAYAEVHQVLQHSGSFISAIPKSFRAFIYENMDKNWCGRLDHTQKLKDMELLQETKIMLSLIYRDFICTEDERKALVEAERLELEKNGIEYEDQSLRDLFTD